MSSKYIDFVLCTKVPGGVQSMFYAPGFSHIEKGDLVLVETDEGKTTADVVASVTVDREDEAMVDMLMRLYGSRPDSIKRVNSKVRFTELDYSEWDEVTGG